MRIAVFASGTGSNFTAIADAIQANEIKGAQIGLVFSDKPAAPVIEKARARDHETLVLEPAAFASKAAFERKLIEELQDHAIDFIVLAGYMRIIGNTLLSAYEGRVINIHPSLLPSFPGKSGIADAFAYGVKVTGVTVHYVDAGIDTGPIIAQEIVRIDTDDTLTSVTEKIHQVEHQIYPAVLAEIVEKGLSNRE
ncbi:MULTISPECIES: phosphoribosylglycinamide formyltransferase [Enterococcus]|uniref:phosphoribosylglycinamide formyltransferase n=1 Tax=Enterococcus TaxID=1350 RepID=UPI00191A8A54|nr:MULTISPECIES: phosphoribosylglycinamide formyltransferase [Enterococcus]MDO0895480.1 phosphoribosylglycinamide formyltransferase [Enterococcus sp. B1E4]MDO0908434.1 phosphoribosylglycinamide formyltransferase [Enterococcus sp. B2E4]MDR3826530.1 phosphoribosylglycinamide formyltransferase [Enterococcus sp.]QQU16195.1 phosphoribosylglycinamide formyltransferase [Enterococcus casseliflavus]